MATVDQIKEIVNAAVGPVIKSVDSLTNSLNGLTLSHQSLKDAIEAQNSKIEELTGAIGVNRENVEKSIQATAANNQSIKHLEMQVNSLENQIDDLEQSKLDTGVLLSGDIISNFINFNPDLGSTPCHEGHATVTKLEETLCPAPSQDNQNPLNITFQFIKKVKGNNILARLNSRDKVHVLFRYAKESNRGFFANEQLTRKRQQMSREARRYLNDLPEVDWSIYTRNGILIFRLGNEEPVRVKTWSQLDSFIFAVERRRKGVCLLGTCPEPAEIMSTLKTP